MLSLLSVISITESESESADETSMHMGSFPCIETL